MAQCHFAGEKKCAVHLYKSIQSEVTPCTQHGRAIDILKIVLTLETLGAPLFSRIFPN